MKLKFILTTVAIVASVYTLKAQYAGDALRFSQTLAGSSARFKGIGNAQTAFGGDISSLGANPAGLGFFTKSDLGLTLEYNNYNSLASYLNRNTNGTRDALNINQAGAVFHIPSYRPKGSDLEKGWVSFDFGLGYNRNADFGNMLVYSGTNPNNSIADYFAELATNNPGSLEEGTLEKMALYDYLIEYDAQNDIYTPNTNLGGSQSKLEERIGGQGQFNLAFAGNYSNKFYIGLNLGFASLRYLSNATFTESGYNFLYQSNYKTSYIQDQNTQGRGFNAKLGLIFRPIPNIRLGASYETPTWYTIDDSYTEVLKTKHVKAGLENINDPENYTFTYRLRTPSKLSLGLGIILGNFGLLSADVDAVDYTKINFRSMDNTDLGIIYDNNSDVANQFKKAYNYRIGAEFKLDQILVRGGYGIQGNPYRNLDDKQFQTTTLSGGLGYRYKKYYFDLTYQQTSFHSDLKPYQLADNSGPRALVETDRNNVFATFGIKF